MNRKHSVMKFLHLSICLFLFVSCDSTNKKKQKRTEVKKDTVLVDTSTELTDETVKIEKPLPPKALEIIVMQCANGYDYSQQGYDFNPIIEKELNTFKNINVQPFPDKALMGVSYQGVFDKKYCPPIIEKVDADFLILTQFDKRLNVFDTLQKWGYELRIVETKTLKQMNSISIHNTSKYEDIEKHIKDNINKLKTDIERMKERCDKIGTSIDPGDLKK